MTNFQISNLSILILTLGRCPWKTPTKLNNVYRCRNGDYCNSNEDVLGEECCKIRGGRIQCPKNKPVMCAKKMCSGGTEYCCHKNCNSNVVQEGSVDYGGRRTCGRC